MPERQRGALRWIVLALVLAVFIALMLAKTDESDHAIASWASTPAPIASLTMSPAACKQRALRAVVLFVIAGALVAAARGLQSAQEVKPFWRTSRTGSRVPTARARCSSSRGP